MDLLSKRLCFLHSVLNKMRRGHFLFRFRIPDSRISTRAQTDKNTKIQMRVEPKSGPNVLTYGSPDLVVMGGGSCSKGRGFESRHRILDGHLFVVKFVMMFVWKDRKEAGVGPFL